MKTKKWGRLTACLIGSAVLLTASADAEAQQIQLRNYEKNVQRLRVVQDDAQDYMVSKIYKLKYIQANDITPFVMGIVMRYNMNSSVNCIEYGAENSQMLTVTCPVQMMPYVDDFIKKADRNVLLDGKVPGDIVKGTGITRAVYRPKYRSGEALLNVLVNSVIGEGPWGSVYAWDQNSNQIYWKDNSSNTSYVYQFLGYLDRPAPQITFTFQIVEVRESVLRDIGIEYLAWKNGPGLNIFETAWDVFSVNSAGSTAVQSLSGPVGGFFTAPQFDASFIRLLAQGGEAKITNTATLTAANSDTAEYSISFDPQLQNILKSDQDQMSVTGNDSLNGITLTLSQPIVNIQYGQSQPGYPSNETFAVANYKPGTCAKYPGTVFFQFNLTSSEVVERNNMGAQLVETGSISSSVLLKLNEETVLGQWQKEQEVEQTIGIPYLIRIPVLKYLFGTTTKTREKTRVYVTIKAEMLNTAKPQGFEVGKLQQIKKGAF